MRDRYSIAVVGAGYVGASLAYLLAKNNDVIVFDTDKKKISKVNKLQSPIADKGLEKFIKKEKKLNISGTESKKAALYNADYIIIATPTDYNENTKKFDTTHVDSVVEDALKINSKCSIVIKSTIPIGHTEKLKQIYNTNRIIFSPEFLREGMALYDNINPSRIIIGSHSAEGRVFAKILLKLTKLNKPHIIFMSSTEAEAVKLFSNTYLALRVAYFNEVDSFAYELKLNPKNIINGVSLDPRIGTHYNNPSFGYGGYCLPKDTKQLAASFELQGIPERLISAVTESNLNRQDFLANKILSLNPRCVGVYKLAMKKGSDNHRSSAIFSIIDSLSREGIKIVIYEPSIKESQFDKHQIQNDIKIFNEMSDIIIANRYDDHEIVGGKIFTRDIFKEN